MIIQARELLMPVDSSAAGRLIDRLLVDTRVSRVEGAFQATDHSYFKNLEPRMLLSCLESPMSPQGQAEAGIKVSKPGKRGISEQNFDRIRKSYIPLLYFT